MPCRAQGWAIVINQLICIYKSLGWRGVEHSDMLKCWRCGRSWRNTAILLAWNEFCIQKIKTCELGHLKALTSFRERVDLPLMVKNRCSTYIIHGRMLSINIITLLLLLLLASLHCPLLVSSRLICIFVKQAIGWTVPKLLFPRKKSCLHRIRNSFFGCVVRKFKKSFSLIGNS